MNEIELLRSLSDRRTYNLGHLGSLRLKGLLLRSAVARTELESFTVEKTRWTRASVVARGQHGAFGRFDAGMLRAGGRVMWKEEEHSLVHEQLLGETYALIREDRRIAVARARGWWGWGVKRPLTMQVHDASDPALLLFLAFVVRTLANQRSSDASATAAVASTAASTG